MSPQPFDGAFEDGDLLGILLDDQRAADLMTLSSQEDAAALILEFQTRPGPGAWPSLNRHEVAQRLLALILQPRLFLQAGLNLCGPACFFNMAMGRDPVAVTRCATELFEQGVSALGKLRIEPSRQLVKGDYAAMSRLGSVPPQADWMLLSALRNSMQVVWLPTWVGDPTQELAGMTRPEELTEWMTLTGIWGSVLNEGNWMSRPGIPHFLDISNFLGEDIGLLINTNMIAESKSSSFSVQPQHNILLDHFPNHWVILLSTPRMDLFGTNVLLSIWSWGTTGRLVVPKQVFVDNYYGAVRALTSGAMSPADHRKDNPSVPER